MRVLICGDRHWPDDAAFSIGNEIAFLPKDTVIIHGGCKGADLIAAKEAHLLGYATEEHKAEWSTYGRAAGPIRNQAMLDSGVDLVIAFHPNIQASKGTANMIKIAKEAGVEVRVCTS